MFTLPHWLFPGDDRPTEEIDDEIEEELRLHLDLLAEQRVREGATPEDAKLQAAERFGDLDTLKRQCRAEKQGDVPMLKRVQAASTILLLIAVVWLGFRDFLSGVNNAHFMTQTTNQLQDIQDKLVLLDPEAAGSTFRGGEINSTWNTRGATTSALGTALDRIELTVSDQAGAPIEDARLTMFCVENKNQLWSRDLGETDASGRLETRIAMTRRGDMRGVWLVCVAPGYALSTPTMTIEHGKPINSQEIMLEPSTTFRLRLTDAEGAPMRRVSVFPQSRTDLRDQSFKVPEEILNHLAALPSDSRREFGLWKQTDDRGEVLIDWFAARDMASLLFKTRGEEQRRAAPTFEVAHEPNQILQIKDTPNVGLGIVLNRGQGLSPFLPDHLVAASELKDATDPREILKAAVADTQAGRYEDALAKHLWYYENAEKLQPSLSGVRLSSGLRGWYELGCEYPPALAKLRQVRDALEERVAGGVDIGKRFHDLAAINRTLGEDNRTVESFAKLDAANPHAAQNVIHFAKRALLREEAYELYAKHVEGERNYELIQTAYQGMSDRDQFSEYARAIYRRDAATLVAILAIAGREDDANQVAALAREDLDDADFHEELDAAQRGEIPKQKSYAGLILKRPQPADSEAL